MGVAKVVKADGTDPRAFAERRPSRGQGVGVAQAPVSSVHDQIEVHPGLPEALPPLTLINPLAGQVGPKEQRKGHRSSGPAGLGLAHHEAFPGGPHAPAHVGNRAPGIQISPPEPADLAPAHPGRQCDRRGKLEARAEGEREDPCRKGGIHQRRLGANRPRGLGASGGVRGKDPPAHRLGKGLSEDQVKVQDRPGRPAAL